MTDHPEDNNAPRLDWERPRLDADKGREPQLVSGQLGSRWVSLAALVERVEAAFIDEHDDTPELQEADTPAKRLKLVLSTADYVISVESVQVSREEKAEIVNRVYSNLFGYGPLDPLFLDERITTISLDGADKAAVRYGHGELESLGPIFQDNLHFRRVVKRLLIDAGAELRDDQPFMEAGLMVGDRPVCVNLLAPPVTIQTTLDLRVHPKAKPPAEDLLASGFMTQQAADMLRALARSPHGIIIVGEPESGKTTLLSILADWLPTDSATIAVERAGEMRLPAAIERLTTRWPVVDRPGISFGEQIGHALEKNPANLLLDEVRADEPGTIAPLLQEVNAPRQLWSFRGPIFAKRLQSALGMLARRADVGQGEDLVRALYQRLPFVVTLNRVNSALRLWSIAEWQFKHSPDYPTYTPLMQVEEGELRLSGERSSLALDLPDDFWA